MSNNKSTKDEAVVKQSSVNKNSKNVDSTNAKKGADGNKNSGGGLTRFVIIVSIILLVSGLLAYKNHNDIMDFIEKRKAVVTGEDVYEGSSIDSGDTDVDDSMVDKEIDPNSPEAVIKRANKNAMMNWAKANELLGNGKENGAGKVSSSANADHPEGVRHIDEDYSVGPEPPLVSFAPPPETDDIADLNPYEIEAEVADNSKYAPAIPRQIMLQNAAQYRVYLANANRMITKFKQGESFDEELNNLQMRIVSEEISELIAKFADYNELLKNPELSSHKQVDLGFKFLDKFLKIKEINGDYKSVSNLKKDIEAEIPRLNHFLYSDRFQAEFFGK